MLISIFIALLFLAAVLSTWAFYQARQARQAFTEIEGVQLAQYAVGLQGFVVAVQAEPALMPSNPMTRTGVEWLRPPTCGGLATNPEEGYVPCSFRGGTLGEQYQTTITRNPVTNQIEARMQVQAPVLAGNPTTRIMTAELMAETAMRQTTAPALGTFYLALANVPLTANAPHPGPVPAAGDQGRVVVIVNNAPSNDIHLRVAGTNQMLANINLGGFSIANAQDGRFAGDLRVEGRAQLDDGLTVTSGLTDMREGAITTDLALTSIGRFASQGFYNARVLTGAGTYVVPKPDCSDAGNSPAIYTSFQATGNMNHDGTYRADSAFDARIDVQDLGGSWRVTPVMRGTRFGLALSGNDLSLTREVEQTSPNDARVLAMTRCR